MNKRMKFLIGGLVAVLVTAAVVGWVMAQKSAEQPTATAAPSQTLLSRVAANLGVSEEKLIEAITQARLQMIDEAVKQGQITQQQADSMKQRISGSQAMLQMIDEAVKQGRITQQQADWMKQQIAGRQAIGFQGRWGGQGRGGFSYQGSMMGQGFGMGMMGQGNCPTMTPPPPSSP
jgi:polyhydroxyalkanoate synthesis regulator phasin